MQDGEVTLQGTVPSRRMKRLAEGDAEVVRSYLRSAVEALPELAPFHAVFTLDGRERLAVETYSVVVSN